MYSKLLRHKNAQSVSSKGRHGLKQKSNKKVCSALSLARAKQDVQLVLWCLNKKMAENEKVTND